MSPITTASRLHTRISKTVDKATRDLVQAWSRAWDEVAGELEAAITDLAAAGEWPSRTQVMRAEKAKRAVTAVGEKVNELSAIAGVRISADIPAMIKYAEQFTQQVTRSQLPASLSVDWARVDQKAVDAIVKRTTQQITTSLKPLSKGAEAAMKSALVRGVTVGDNPRKAAATMLKRTEDVFNGGRRRAETIARTELLDAHRAASQASRKANRSVLQGWVWLCDLSARTCPACLAMNGTVHETADPGPLGHQNCRCTAIPKSKSWADLGLPELDAIDPGLDLPDAQAWFDQQDKATQLQIMGPGRLGLYQSGKINFSDLATKQSNPDWRDSYQSRTVTDLDALAKRRTRQAA